MIKFCPNCKSLVFRGNSFVLENVKFSGYSAFCKKCASLVGNEKNFVHFPSTNLLSQVAKTSSAIEKCKFCQSYTTDIDLHMVTEHVAQLNIQESTVTNAGVARGPPPFTTPVKFDYKNLAQHLRTPLLPYLEGEWRGIQGDNNSCYIDATLVSMFAFIDHFDFLVAFTQENDCEQKHLRDYIRTQIVNPLRQRFFVSSEAIMGLRMRLVEWLPVADFNKTCEERDVDEVINVLIDQLIPKNHHMPSLLQLFHSPSTGHNNNNDLQLTHILQLTGAENSCLSSEIWISQLLADTMAANKFSWVDGPNVLILKVPRFGASTKKYQHVYPDLSLLANSSSYELASVICINISHYVCFCRSIGDNIWYFFDSMAQRTNEINIPKVMEATMLHQDLFNKKNIRNCSGTSFKRIASDVYVCIYVKNRTVSYFF